MILETGMTKWLGLGVVFEDYGTDLFPGWEKGTVGYHTGDRRIFEAGYAAGYTSKELQVFSKWRASLEHAHYLDKKWYPDSLKLAGRLLLTILLVS